MELVRNIALLLILAMWLAVALMTLWNILEAAKARREARERRQHNIQILKAEVGPSSGTNNG